jgi:hypothetical protein
MGALKRPVLVGTEREGAGSINRESFIFAWQKYIISSMLVSNRTERHFDIVTQIWYKASNYKTDKR